MLLSQNVSIVFDVCSNFEIASILHQLMLQNTSFEIFVFEKLNLLKLIQSKR